MHLKLLHSGYMCLYCYSANKDHTLMIRFSLLLMFLLVIYIRSEIGQRMVRVHCHCIGIEAATVEFCSVSIFGVLAKSNLTRLHFKYLKTWPLKNKRFFKLK